MFKRTEGNSNNDYSVPAKRPRYDTKKGTSSSTHQRDSRNRSSAKSDDIWGDDFAEEDIEEMDFIATQACLQEENTLTQTHQNRSFTETVSHMASTSKCNLQINNTDRRLSKVSSQFQLFHSPRRGEESSKQMSSMSSQPDYKEFESRLIHKGEYNSTFKLEDVIIPEPAHLKELERLKIENKKLLNDFITKDGETAFLRNQLQQTQARAENDRLEKTRFIEEQASRHRSEMNAICKEKEYLKTQLQLQSFEVGNLAERCKLLESGNVKLTEPHSVNLNFSMNKSKSNSVINRLSSSAKSVKVKQVSVQTTHMDNRSSYCLKTWTPHYPLANIPKLLYDTSQPEKSIVDIQITEKTGRRNLPILQEEDTFRIFENPELVKPVTTMIDDRKLTTEFILPEVAAIQRKADSELESENSIPLFNKIVSTGRELILNVIIVLQTIFQAMRNDDIRDMNDIYFSDLYSHSDLNAKSVCDANSWYEGERGVEVRRVYGMLSYAASESTYLSQYVAGRTQLLTERDQFYKHYSQEMIRYNTWSEKGGEFEMLKMILQFVVLVGSTRRSHQFSGLMCAITMVIYNVHEKVGYCSKGMEYVFQIFREIVFSRPLPCCYAVLCNVMTIFVKSTAHLRKLCVNSQSMAVNNWKGALHFTPDACPLQIFLAQMENYRADLITIIDITHASLLFVQYILQTNVIPLRAESSESCNCCMKLLRFTIKTLCKCSEANLCVTDDAKSDHYSLTLSAFQTGINEKCLREMYRNKFAEENSWTAIKRKQLKVLRDGIRFLSHLAICDPDFVIRLSDIEDSFHLFIRNVNVFDNFVLQENEMEAMNRIKQTFIFDKTVQSEVQSYEGNSTMSQLDILSDFEKRFVHPASDETRKNEGHNKMFATFKSLYNTKVDYSDY